jgi:glycine/D-amino acid oxidase-like deaminating enzyme
MVDLNIQQNKTNNVKVSYWEKKEFLDNKDVVIIGSGIVGLFTAYFLKKKNPKLKVLVIERGVLPHGASTKNAGFACFGSPTELYDDLKKMKEDVVWETVRMRWEGLKQLRKILGDKHIGFEMVGGMEIFTSKQESEKMLDFINILNKNMKEIIGKKDVYADVTCNKNIYKFKSIQGIILNQYEGSIQTGRMMKNLLELCRQSGIEVLNGIKVNRLHDTGKSVEIQTDYYIFKVPKVIVTTNGFAAELTGRKDVLPARAQVLITSKIKNLNWNGTFHMDRGFYYFRDLDSRVLLGGGRNLDIEGETTTEFALTEKIQLKLERLLKDIILPDKKFKIEHRWVGIMGVGPEKKPIIEWHDKNILLAVRMGGMGVAIGSMVGKKAAELFEE